MVERSGIGNLVRLNELGWVGRLYEVVGRVGAFLAASDEVLDGGGLEVHVDPHRHHHHLPPQQPAGTPMRWHATVGCGVLRVLRASHAPAAERWRRAGGSSELLSG